ncbi:tyrosine 3-monooxygenase-like [Patiria miniata]|uniref:Biopterin-dependent aromatic amino acid hydroxylase family profile domain-containing protein n=1 Tax=Patiria miniata TaxID=46514 RepID=A0A914BSS4_PATMI|nr:tyrosine 3-monooxygenase-like [Patiria miniata]
MMSRPASKPRPVKRAHTFEGSTLYPSRKSSLIEDARRDSASSSVDVWGPFGLPSPTENDDVFAEEQPSLSPPVVNGDLPKQMCVSFSSREGIGFGSLARAAKVFEMAKAKLLHVESRTSTIKEDGLEFLVQCDVKGVNTRSLVTSLQKIVDSVVIHRDDLPRRGVWFPRHISDLDKCTHLTTEYEPDLDNDHPGFSDKVYRMRRSEITRIAFQYKYGKNIEGVEYTEEETKTWGYVYRQLQQLFTTHACKEHVAAFRELERAGLYSPDFIPQLEDVSKFLQEKSGFQLRPVAGLLTARDFLASLAFRVFQTTQYIRHASSPMHTPEPDCCHELLGHIPILADPGFAQFSQEIGLASLGVSDDDITKLATLYWFTVEFGLCKEGDQVRAYGAGLLSAPGELMYALSDQPEHRSFQASKVAVQEYQDKNYQPLYFVSESFEDTKQKLRAFASSMKKPFDVRYDPFTRRIVTLDTVENVRDTARYLKGHFSAVTSALERITVR